VLRVGLTGGIASGKSEVGKRLAARGAHVAEADQIAHRTMMPGEPVYAEVVRHFGREILDADGTINRQRLAQAAFQADDQGSTRIAELNQLVHPAVVERQAQWMDEMEARDPEGIAVVEAALILEAGVASQFDRLIAVVADDALKVERLARRMGLDRAAAEAEFRRRAGSQLPDQEKARAADYVIYNSGSLAETAEQVDLLFAQLQQQARQHR
jgi:dephospho-CoA kinase